MISYSTRDLVGGLAPLVEKMYVSQ